MSRRMRATLRRQKGQETQLRATRHRARESRSRRRRNLLRTGQGVRGGRQEARRGARSR